MSCKIKNYAAAEKLYVRVKNPTKGKPLGVQGMRLHKLESGTFEVRYDGWREKGIPFCRISPDNTLTFVMPEEKIVQYSNSLAIIADRVVPFLLERKSKGIYTISTHWRPTEKYEYFEGMIWKVGLWDIWNCVNPKRSLTDRVNKERRLEWLRDLRAFKRSFKQKSVMGITDDAIKKMAGQRITINQYDTTPEAVAGMIKRRECTTDDIRVLAYACSTWRWEAERGAHEKNILNYLNSESLNIRKAYGVFDET